MRTRIAGLLVLWVALTAATGSSQVTTGTISGTVKDATGAVLPGATITVVNEETGFSRTVQTDAAGYYTAPSLNPGGYQITASLQGFQKLVRSGIELTLGRQAVVNLELQVGAVTQTVEVTAEAPLVDTVGGSLGETIDSSTITELPLNGRDLASLVLLQTGVVNFTEGNQETGKLLIVSGGRATNNVFYMDGIAIESFNQKTPTGESGNFLGSEAVREFKVDTNAYSAEYGRGSGGIFNIATKSGTNRFHGSVFEYLRNDNLDAAQWEDNAFGGGEKPEFKRNQFGGSLGGPILRDKTFFFGAYEGYRERLDSTRVSRTFGDRLRAGFLTATATTPVGIDPRTRPYLDFYPRPNGATLADGTGDFISSNPVPTNEDFLQGRVDHRFSDSDLAYVRYTFQDSNRHNTDPFPEEGGMIFTSRSQYVTVEDKHIFSPALLASIRAGFTRTAPFEEPENRRELDKSLLFNPNIPYLGSLSPGSGITGIGVGESGDGRRVTSYQLASDWNYIKGRNTFKFGMMWIRINFNGFQPARDSGNYAFSTVADFFGDTTRTPALAPLVNRFRGSVFNCCADPYRSWKQNITGLYFQDEWRLTPRLTVTPGLRYEFITVPNEKHGRLANFNGDLAFFWRATQANITKGNPWFENPSLKNFAPRIGLAWDVFGNGKTAVRSGFGLFFQQFDQAWIRTVAFRMPPFLIEVEGGGSTIPFPSIFQLCSTDSPTSPANPSCAIALPVPNWVPEKFSTPYAMQYNLNIQHQLSSDTIVTVGYSGSRGVRLPSISDVNVHVGQQVGERLVFPSAPVCRSSSNCRPNPNFDRMRYRSPMANSWYNALQISAQKKMAQGLQFSASYTYARTLDEISGNQTASDTDTGVQSSYYHDRTLYKGLSAFDARNVFTFSSTYELPVGPGKFFGSGMSGVAEMLLAGWELGGIVTLRSGFPFTITRGARTEMSRIGITDEVPDLAPGFSNNPTSGTSNGCSRFPSATGKTLGTPELYYDPCAFVPVPTVTTFGNLGRNTLILPGLATVDVTLGKNFRITEGTNLQFRFEGYNFFNRVNFGRPGRNIFDRRDAADATAARIESSSTARQIQFGLKLTF